ncbi:hypothetical protein DKP78_25355 [Enterococcus faecium]|nr:hypothetical protein DKP78_25355 [Enterococcus faecium]
MIDGRLVFTGWLPRQLVYFQSMAMDHNTGNQQKPFPMSTNTMALTQKRAIFEMSPFRAEK